MDPFAWRGVERIVIVLGGIAFAYFGYRLYVLGVVKGRLNANADLKFAKIALAGGGPGLGFMFMGAIVLASAIWHGGVDMEKWQNGQREERIRIPESGAPPPAPAPASQGSPGGEHWHKG